MPEYIFTGMKKTRTARTILAIAVALGVAIAAQSASGQAFRPAAAADASPPTSEATVARTSFATEPRAVTDLAPVDPTATATLVAPAVEPASAPVAAEQPAATTAPVQAPPAAPARLVAAPTAASTPVRTAAPPAPTVAPPVATPTTCPATWFCYPRLGVAGAIVPYTDCSGATDVGTSIRSFTCLSPFYLMGHAYTQFGLITQWRAGDVVFASGRQFTISGAFTQSSCEAPARAPAPLSLQTSLTSGGCGSVLVVQAN